MAESAIEPRIRLAIPDRPKRLDRKLFLRPIAKIRQNTPARISPALKSVAVEPSTPKRLI